MKHHYIYKSFEEWGREYIGIRSCDCLPEEDTEYFGSFYDKTFNPTGKTILFTGETRQEVAEIEIELHDFFDVAVNPQFANKAKATSTGFDRAGMLDTEETRRKKSVSRSGEKNHQFGVPKTKEWKKAHSERMSGENNPNYGRTGEKHPQFGAPHTKEWKKAHSERMSGEKNSNHGNTGALNPLSKAIIAIEPDGTQQHYGGISEAARELEIPLSTLCYRLKKGHVPTKGKFKDWQFLFKNSENF
jgi:hypothetical protein